MSPDELPADDATATDRRPSRSMAALCGVLAGALGLGVAELIAGLVPGAPSPVLSIGALLISLQPPNAKQLVVDLFGTADKAVLSVAVVIGALVLSAGIGLLARRSLVAGRVAFGALGLFALLAAVLDPLFDPVLAMRDRGGGHRRQRLVAGLAAAPGHAAQWAGGADDGLRAPALPRRSRGRGGSGRHQRADRPARSSTSGHPRPPRCRPSHRPRPPPRRCRQGPSWRSTASPRWSCPTAASTGSTPACSPRALDARELDADAWTAWSTAPSPSTTRSCWPCPWSSST